MPGPIWWFGAWEFRLAWRVGWDGHGQPNAFGMVNGVVICFPLFGSLLTLFGKICSFGAICVISCRSIHFLFYLPPGLWWKFTIKLAKAAHGYLQMAPTLPFNFLIGDLPGRARLGLLIPAFVLIGTYAYALSFVQIYNHQITRIAASEWMLENISAPLNLIVESPSGNRSYPVAVGIVRWLNLAIRQSANVNILQNGTSSTITTTDVRQVGVNFYFNLTRDEEGKDIITEGRLPILDNDQNQKQLISFGDINLEPERDLLFQLPHTKQQPIFLLKYHVAKCG